MKSVLLADLYEFTMAQAYFTYRRDAYATFDLFVRNVPKSRGYLVASGLEDILNYLEKFSFEKEDIRYLRSLGIFSREFLKYLSAVRFKGELWAMPEGTVFFAGEPIIRVTAPIIQAQIIESYLLNTINLQTMIASKASRVVCAAKDRAVYDFSLRRTHGPDAGIKVARSAYLSGVAATSNVLAAKLYNIPAAGTMAHSFIESFKDEMDAFLAYAETFPAKSIFLVDTYNTEKGIKNAVIIGSYLKEKGYRLLGIRLDSGDLVALSKMARKAFNKAGLGFVKIFASGNLDEFKIKELISRGAQIDSFGVGTNMGTSIDAPSLDVVYKLSEVTDENGKFIPVMKLSKDKITFPGRKQVYRVKDRKGRFIKDILGLDNEKINGTPLLKKVMRCGKRVGKRSSLAGSRLLCRDNISCLAPGLKEVYPEYKYPVLTSNRLMSLRSKLSQSLHKRQ